MKRLMFVAIVVLLGSMVVPACAGILFQDDFNDGNKNGWTDTAVHPWWSSPGTSVVSGGLTFANLGMSLADALNGVENVDITVDVPVVGQSQVIVLRYKDEFNYVAAWYQSVEQDLYFFQVSGGWDFIGRVDTPDLAGPISLHATAVGADLTFSATDGTHSYSTSHVLPAMFLGSGKYGLMATTELGSVRFDNFVASTPVPEPASLLGLGSALLGMAGLIRRRR